MELMDGNGFVDLGLVCTGARVTGLVEQRGRPLLQFADGRAECVDLVLFADGRSSIGRVLFVANDGDEKMRNGRPLSTTARSQ